MIRLQRSLRFVVGGLMLAVMAAWINANHDPALTGVVWLVGLTALLAFVGARTGDDPKSVTSAGMIAVVVGVLSVAGRRLARPERRQRGPRRNARLGDVLGARRRRRPGRLRRCRPARGKRPGVK